MQTIEEFKAEALAFLQANAEPKREVSLAWGEGSEDVGIFTERTAEEDAREVAGAKEWRAKVWDAGFGWISGPEQYGGRGLPKTYERAYLGLEAGFHHP